MKRIISLSVIILAALLTVILYIASPSFDEKFTVCAEDNSMIPESIEAFSAYDGSKYLFLPESVEGENVTVSSERGFDEVSGSSIVKADRKHGKIVCKAENGSVMTVDGTVVKIRIGSLPTMNISIGDGYSINTIRRSKDEKIEVTVRIDGTDGGRFDLSPIQAEMKTRGSSTFEYAKKPYQLKFDSKTSLFGMGKAKKWVLLANYIDGTSMRNKIAYDLGEELGCEYTPESVFLDLYIDGRYAGVYQLIEKIEEGKNRVDLKNSSGVLLEFDSEERIDPSEDVFFKTEISEKPIVYKDSVTDLNPTEDEYTSSRINEIRTYTEDYINRFEEALYDENSDWKTVSSMIDVDSFVRFFFISELSEEVDSTFSSTYMYLDGKGDVLHMAPIWDYDRCFGWNTEYVQDTDADFIKNITENVDDLRVDWYKQLFRHPEFVDAVNEFYEKVAKNVFSTNRISEKIDRYGSMLKDSILMNCVRWNTISLDEDITVSGIDEEEWESYYKTAVDTMKEWIFDRCRYISTAYGENFPVISYSVSDQNGEFGKKYTGGCMTDMTTVAGMEVSFADSSIDGGVEYTLYYQGEEYSAKNGELLKPDSDRFTGLSVRLTGNIANYFSVEYRTVRQNGLWSERARDGEIAGASEGRFSQYGIKAVEIRLRAKKSIMTSVITFNVLDESITTEGINGNSIELSVPEIDGYVFEGWYLDPDFSGEALTSLVFENDISVYARMIEKQTEAGDADRSGTVDVRDSVALKKMTEGVIGHREVNEANADLDCDGVFTEKDAFLFKKLITN